MLGPPHRVALHVSLHVSHPSLAEAVSVRMLQAVANHTTASFIRVVGSEFVQKYLGEGPRMVRDVFRLARENAPAIIFIDEVDAIATKRFDAQTGADREVQRILMELLTQVRATPKTPFALHDRMPDFHARPASPGPGSVSIGCRFVADGRF